MVVLSNINHQSCDNVRRHGFNVPAINFSTSSNINLTNLSLSDLTSVAKGYWDDSYTVTTFHYQAYEPESDCVVDVNGTTCIIGGVEDCYYEDTHFSWRV